MATKILRKDPDELKSYAIDFANKLASGDSLTGTPVVTVSPSGPTLGSASISGTTVVFTVEGGTEDTMYVITANVDTAASNELEACVRLYVKDCSAFVEMLMMLRVLINDLDDSDYTYTENRLLDVLVVAAKYVQQDIDLVNTYTINVRTHKISPDPTDDDQFTTLVVLKSACILDQGKFRSQALLEGIKASCGPASLSVAGNSAAFKTILEKGPCAGYAELRDANNFGDFQGVHAILSPFNGPQWSPDEHGYYGNRFFRY
jgi:hypothetical protein